MHKSHSDEGCTKSPRDWSEGAIPDREPVFTTLRQLLPPRELPDAEALSDTELIALLNDLELDLLQARVQVDFLDTLPARVAYKGILQALDTPVESGPDRLDTFHLDGCDSACESCFQLAHCAIAREVLGKDWRLAVEQAGINPSWSALFAREAED